MLLSPLRSGDRIALLAPASPFETEKFTRTSELLQARGFQVILGDHIFQRYGYLAGTEADPP